MQNLFLILLLAFWGGAACAQDAANGLGEGEAGRVLAITGPLSVRVQREEDEVEVRLGGLDTPVAAAAQAWLETRLDGQAIEVIAAAPNTDRYDRLIAQLVLNPAAMDGGEVWVQEALIEAGLARFLAYDDTEQIAPALLHAEARARSAGRGLWSEAAHQIRDTNPDRLVQDLGTLQLVEGRVMDVTRLDDGRTYINFGADWRTDFTVRIDARDAGRFDAAALLALESYRVRVRGVILEENGPMIRLAYPGRLDQLED